MSTKYLEIYEDKDEIEVTEETQKLIDNIPWNKISCNTQGA